MEVLVLTGALALFGLGLIGNVYTDLYRIIFK
ncbi:MAG: hypothetical protein ACI9TV_001225 [Sulfurimonas sp.]|jgi:hypothetical protein